MTTSQLIAVLPSGRTLTIRVPDNETAEQALRDLTMRSGGGAQPQPWTKVDWLETEERFWIRRDAIVALVVGRKEGEWAVAD